MHRVGFGLLILVFIGCGNKKTNDKKDGFSFAQFANQFKTVSTPYQLSDTALFKNRDTASIRPEDFEGIISDSLKLKLFGKGKIKYLPLVKIKGKDGISYYVVKAVSGNRKAALLLTFSKDRFGALLPFIVPDDNATTSQLSSIDNSLSISKNVIRKKTNGVVEEGKEVYEYDAPSKKFLLIMTNPLDNSHLAIINPIDTLPHKHKFTGDYIKDKRNFVSVRDGRSSSQLLFFIHFEKNNAACTGELKGNLLFTSPTTAIYRQGGDPCVLTFRFTATSVSIKEDEGCGSHRGLNCVFDDTFQRKKELKSKQIKKKKAVK